MAFLRRCMVEIVFLLLLILGNVALVVSWQMLFIGAVAWAISTAAFTVLVLITWFLVAALPVLHRSLWWPGIVLYFAMVLPWFIAVQHQNPSFFREFFLEHNLQRFATDRYQHSQPIWYYLVVMLLALMPWTVLAVRALMDGILTSVAEWRLRYSRAGNVCPRGPATPFLNSWCCGLSFRSCSFLSLNPNFPGTSFPPSRPSPSSPATTFSAAANRG